MIIHVSLPDSEATALPACFVLVPVSTRRLVLDRILIRAGKEALFDFTFELESVELVSHVSVQISEDDFCLALAFLWAERVLLFPIVYALRTADQGAIIIAALSRRVGDFATDVADEVLAALALAIINFHQSRKVEVRIKYLPSRLWLVCKAIWVLCTQLLDFSSVLLKVLD